MQHITGHKKAIKLLFYFTLVTFYIQYKSPIHHVIQFPKSPSMMQLSKD